MSDFVIGTIGVFLTGALLSMGATVAALSSFGLLTR
jgi:hypothetical protein